MKSIFIGISEKTETKYRENTGRKFDKILKRIITRVQKLKTPTGVSGLDTWERNVNAEVPRRLCYLCA
jgi:hypothetical protein